MHSKIFLSASIALLISFAATAQTARQPFDDIGKEVKVLSLTNGKYEEFFDDDSLQRIGTALVNINTMKVVKLVLTEEEERIMDNSESSRFLSVDPLSKNYPSWSPYPFAMNSPIAGVDLDGLEFYFAADGSYLGQSKNGGTQIRVATEYHTNPKDKSQLIFTNYKEIDKVDESIASKVYATIYKREVKNPHSPNVSASAKTSEGGSAGTNPKNKYITVYFKASMSSDDGTQQKPMTDYYNAASTLNHEDDHAAGLTNNGFDHFKVEILEANNRFQSKVS